MNIKKLPFTAESRVFTSFEEVEEQIKYSRHPQHLPYIKIKNCTFEFTLELTSNYNFLEFESCEFKKGFVYHHQIELNTFFTNCIFSACNLQNARFKGKARFRCCTFYNINFQNTRFLELADFWDSKFEDTVIFYKTDFLGTVVFSRTIFNKNVLFTYSLIDKILILRGAVIKEGLDLSLAIVPGALNLFDLNISDYKVKDTPSNSDRYDKYVTSEGIIPLKNKRETFRMLKKYHLDHNNAVEYHDFALLESKTIRKETWQNIIKTWQGPIFTEKLTGFKDFLSNLLNYILLLLNRASNNHGTQYGRGILFTAVVAWLFFYLSIISTYSVHANFNPSNWSCTTFETGIKYYFISLLPTHDINYMQNEQPTYLFYVADILGRIFVSYGIYQTIQAFRKYK